MHFTIETSNGIQTVELEGTGGSICFGVRDAAGNQSSLWAIKAHEGQSDVYVGNYHLSDFLKFSFHRDNRWHFAWTQEHARLLFPRSERDDRWIDRWRRPSELGAGWTLALRIWILPGDLRPGDTPPAPQGIFRDVCTVAGETHWIPEPEPGACWGFHVWLGRPDRGTLELRNAMPIAAFALREDRSGPQACVLMLGRKWPTYRDLDWISRERQRVSERAWAAGFEPIGPYPRAVLYGSGEGEVREVFDLALSPSNGC